VRVGLVDGCRTPFTKAGGQLAPATVLDLSIHAVRETCMRVELAENEVDGLIMGAATPDPAVPYLARETAIALEMMWCNAYSVESACATSARSIANLACEIERGERTLAVAGGAESMSNLPVLVNRTLANAVLRRPRGTSELDVMLSVALQETVPQVPAVVEPYTGLQLGEHAEEIVRDWHVDREDADQLAFQSHMNASSATADGRLPAEIAPIVLADTGTRVDADNLIRPTTTLERIRSLPPVFGQAGTVTAANASPLTDGAAAVLLGSEEAINARGLSPKVWLRSWAFTSHPPKVGVLLGPAFALPLALDRAGLELSDVGLVDLHEAFAGQVLANLAAMADDEFARSILGRDRAIGTIDRSLLNVCGGSIAIGHPFGATGARITLQLANEMTRRKTKFGAAAICAGGTRGAAFVLELAE
jgi:acetyl-CoA acyltransferase